MTQDKIKKSQASKVILPSNTHIDYYTMYTNWKKGVSEKRPHS